MDKDNKGCCDDAEYKEVEDEACGCGSSYVEVDESIVDNPENPKYIAENDFFKELEKYAHYIGIKSIGYTQVTPQLLIEDKFIQYPNTIVLTMEMSNKIIETPPGPEALELNNAAYEKLGKLTYKISDYLRENGFATQVAHPFGSLVNFSPLAQKAGMGHIGKNGLLITPELGPRQKISAIFVSIANLPLKHDNPYTWIPEYCEMCGKCIKACPEEALIETETCCSGKQVNLYKNSA